MDAKGVIKSRLPHTGPPKEVGGAGRGKGSGLKHSLTLNIIDMWPGILQYIRLNLRGIDIAATESRSDSVHVHMYTHNNRSFLHN